MVKQFYLTHWYVYNRYYRSGQSGPGINGIDRLLHIPQSSRSAAWPSDSVKCYTQDTEVIVKIYFSIAKS